MDSPALLRPHARTRKDGEVASADRSLHPRLRRPSMRPPRPPVPLAPPPSAEVSPLPDHHLSRSGACAAARSRRPGQAAGARRPVRHGGFCCSGDTKGCGREEVVRMGDSSHWQSGDKGQ